MAWRAREVNAHSWNMRIWPFFRAFWNVPRSRCVHHIRLCCEGHHYRRGTMKRTLMVSVAALALAAGSTIAMSQGNSGRGEGGGASAPMNNPAGAGASGGASGQINESPAPGRGAQDRAVPEKQQKAQQAPSGTQAPNARQTQ